MTTKQVVAISTPGTVKAAALLFDKVFIIELPTEEDSSSAEINSYIDREKPEWLLNRAVLKLDPGFVLRSRDEGVLALGRLAELIAQFMGKNRNEEYNTIPVYKTVVDLERDLVPEKEDSYPGAVTAHLAALNFVQQPDDTTLSWKKIESFREDKTSVDKYRALRTWLPRALGSSSVAEAEDRISELARDVELTFRKHSIETRKGSFQLLFDWETLKKSLPLAIVAGLAVNPIWIALLGGLMAVERIHCHLKERRVVLEEQLRKNDLEAAAVLSEMRELAGG
jgi:hypothetical protein